MKKIYILSTLLICCLFSSKVQASHIVGGEVYYDALGNNQYKVTFEIFRDCAGNGAPFDQPLSYTIFYQDGSIFSQYNVDLFSSEVLPIVYDDPCVTPPDDICIERGVYIDTVILPFDVDGYYISYQRCCWSNSIDNITDPTSNGITLTTSVPGSALLAAPNNAARFNNYPPLVLCSGNTLNFDHSAFDADGDSLVYTIKTPYIGGGPDQSNPNGFTGVTPNPESAAPYTPSSWNPGYSETVPFGPGSSVTVNSQTGMIAFSPNLIGSYVAGIQVDEYRDGVLINSHVRTYGYRIVACQVEIPVEVDITGPNSITEDCGFAGFIVSRSDSTDELTVQVLLSGTATNGVDYPFIPDTLIIPANVGSDTIGISAYYDQLTEGNETVDFNIIIQNICEGTYDTTSISLTIVDYNAMTITSTDSINICSEMGETAMIGCDVDFGVMPYTYYWQPFNWPNTDSIFITGAVLQPNLNLFRVFVTDACGKTIQSQDIQVYEQCPISAPNVLTLNGDGTNDAFFVNNLDNFNKVALTIVDRWGITVYYNGDYKNDWKGLDQSGKELTDGVYFYTVTPESEKYKYDDAKKTEFTVHGFVHLIKK